LAIEKCIACDVLTVDRIGEESNQNAEGFRQLPSEGNHFCFSEILMANLRK
jgi:hypothetical protein